MSKCGKVVISNKKYIKFLESSKEFLTAEQIEQMNINFKTIFNFDPEQKTISEKVLKKQQEKRDLLKEQGISTTISSGMNKVYEKKKLSKNLETCNTQVFKDKNNLII
jgi:hypothetical protein